MYPDSAPISTMQTLGVGDQGNLSQWINEDTIRIADYYYVRQQSATLQFVPRQHDGV
jgi:hypothetical protein